MIGIELLVVLAAIYLGARIGSIGIGFAGGLGVLVLTWGLGMCIFPRMAIAQ
ncbi:anaerobic C4-dicarboxylate transporter family protein [Aeromonas caviae]|uniref:anaerobic C4-dicarboxylate transporter family protein n=1 Tax=Aeromonas caviae TaxID=648 RepID=UPI0039778E4C